MLNFAKTNIGKARSMNQDYYYISEDGCLNILADGMGGYAGGEVASKLATTSVINYFKEHFKKDENYTDEKVRETIKEAMEYANIEVYHKAKTKEELDLMGTTLEICLVYNNKIFIGHIGDSRIYRIRNGIMNKITTDHSYVQTLVEDGTITPEEAEHHPKKNMLMKALGCEEEVNADIIEEEFLKDDIILICSDGLTNMVEEEQILKTIEENIEQAPEKLVELANKNGGLDNITLIIIKNS